MGCRRGWHRYALKIGKRLGQRGGVAGGRGRSLEFTAHIENEATGGGVAAGAGVVVKAVFVRATVVVDDRRAQMEAVAQGGAADAASH